MNPLPLIRVLFCLAFFAPIGQAREKAPEQGKSAGKDQAEPPPPSDAPESYVLGDPATLGKYQFSTPAGWTAAELKDNKFVAMYRSPDRTAVIRVQVRPNGAVSPEAQPKYAPVVIQKLKQDYLKNKTEIIDPPTVQKDPRFFLTIRELIKIKGEKLAVQSHLYQMPVKDLIELTVITTSEVSAQVAATQKLAEDMLLSFNKTAK